MCCNREKDVERVTVRAKVPALHTYTFHVTYEELVLKRTGSYVYNLHISPRQVSNCSKMVLLLLYLCKGE